MCFQSQTPNLWPEDSEAEYSSTHPQLRYWMRMVTLRPIDPLGQILLYEVCWAPEPVLTLCQERGSASAGNRIAVV
jgi:hypothetical protein